MDFIAMLSTVSMAVLPPILAVLATIFIPIALAALFKWLEKNGLVIEQHNRDALQSALKNAALVAIQRSMGNKSQPSLPTVGSVAGSIAMEVIPNVGASIEYVKKSVPDAVKEFKLDTGRIKDLLEPHIAEAAMRAGVTLKSN